MLDKYNLLMGNDIPKREHKEVRPEHDIRIGHEKFQHFRLDEEQDLIEVTYEVESERDIKAWDNELKRVNAFQDRETLLLPVKHQFIPRGFCGNIGSVRIYYENYPYLFEEEIESRTSMGKHFDEEELWYLLYSLASSARDFNKIERKIGDVRPYNIFINDEGQIKIANLYSWPYERTNFEKTVFEKQLTFLSPEEMRLIAKGNHDNTTDRMLSETFSIGLTLLQSGLLTNVKEIYSLDNYSVDFNKLAQKLGEWQNLQFIPENPNNPNNPNHNNNQNNAYHSYSQLLREIVSRMCSVDERERLSSVQVEEALRPYQNEILNLIEFDHKNVKLPRQAQKAQPVEAVQRPAEVVQVQRPVQVVEVQRPVEVVHVQAPGSGRQSNTPAFTIPQQTIMVPSPIQPKSNAQRSSEGSPVRIPVHHLHNHKTNSPNKGLPFNNLPVSTNPQHVGHQSVPLPAYEQQFYRYTHHPPPQIQNHAPTFSGPAQHHTQNIGVSMPRPPSNPGSNIPIHSNNVPIHSSNVPIHSGNIPINGGSVTFGQNPPAYRGTAPGFTSNIQPTYTTSTHPTYTTNTQPGYTTGNIPNYVPSNQTVIKPSGSQPSYTPNSSHPVLPRNEPPVYPWGANEKPAVRSTVNEGVWPNSGFNASGSRPATVVPASSGVGDGSLDFLKKIDQQLQNSRRQFPN